MKTAIDLADRLRDLTSKTKCPSYERGIMNGAIEMLRQQAEQIESFKADAERFTTLAEYLVSDRTEYDDAIVDARTVEQLRAAIDAMKGKS